MRALGIEESRLGSTVVAQLPSQRALRGGHPGRSRSKARNAPAAPMGEAMRVDGSLVSIVRGVHYSGASLFSAVALAAFSEGGQGQADESNPQGVGEDFAVPGGCQGFQVMVAKTRSKRPSARSCRAIDQEK
ncbi:hypothetical protein GCM10009834_02620 [Streptomonospora arabica]